MKRQAPGTQDALELVSRVDPKFKPVWDARNEDAQVALARYFLPWASSKPRLGPTRPKVIKWYCPFAAQKDFPSAHRYCINVFTGCSHNCVYCYANGYEPDRASTKRDFERLIDKDMEGLETFDVPAAPIHLSNSTDAFQPIEEKVRHTRYALEQILTHRDRFTTVTVLTKNPLRPARNGYLDLFKALGALPDSHPSRRVFADGEVPVFQVEVSLAFWRDEARATYDLNAPTVEERKEGIQALREAEIPVVLRIDPLFPRSPLPDGKALADFALQEAQTLADLESLVTFAAQCGVRHVVYSPLKVVQPRHRRLGATMVAMRDLYRAMSSPAKPAWKGGSWRLPPAIAEVHVMRPFLRMCAAAGLQAKFCMENLIETP